MLKNPNLNENNVPPLFMQLEGNVWDILGRIKKRALREKKEHGNNQKQQDKDDESSWIESDDSIVTSDLSESEEDEVEDLPPKLAPNLKKEFSRSSTYRMRKNNILSKLDKASSDSFSSEKSDTGNNFSKQLSLNLRSTSVPIKVFTPQEDVKQIEKDEEEAAHLIKKLVRPAMGIDVEENEVKVLHKSFVQNVLNIHNRVRVIDLDDIQLEEKTSLETDSSDAAKIRDILSLFFSNQKAKMSKKRMSSVVQFLVDNNIQSLESVTNQAQNATKHKKRASVGKQMTMESQVSNKEADELSPKKRERRLTMNTHEADNLFGCKICKDTNCDQGSICQKEENITDEGKFIVLYTSIQLLFNHILDVTNVIEKYGLKNKSDRFCLANIYKLFGLTYLMEEARNDAIMCFDKSLRIFKELKSYHGQATIYYLKSLAVSIHDYEDEYNNVNSTVEARKYAEKSMLLYKLLQHKQGFLAAAALCGSDENPPNRVVKLDQMHDPNYIPYIERETPLEFISLGIEPILTTKFEIKD